MTIWGYKSLYSPLGMPLVLIRQWWTRTQVATSRTPVWWRNRKIADKQLRYFPGIRPTRLLKPWFHV